MSSTTMVHLPQPSDRHPLEVRSDIQESGTAVLSLKVLGDVDLHIFTDNPAHLRQIANVALDLAAELAASHLYSKEASE